MEKGRGGHGNKIVLCALTVCLFLGLGGFIGLPFAQREVVEAATLTAADFSGGNGTEANPYQITNTTQLAKLTNAVSGQHFVLMNDLAISNAWGINGNFKGDLDGNGHKLTITHAGLCLENSGTIRNFTFDCYTRNTSFDSYLYYRWYKTNFLWCYYGPIAAVNWGSINNVTGSIDIRVNDSGYTPTRTSFCGGIAGFSAGDIRSCGVVGRDNYAQGVNVVSTGSTTINYVGGIVGCLNDNAIVWDCYARGTFDINCGSSTNWSCAGSAVGYFNGDNVSIGYTSGYNTVTNAQAVVGHAFIAYSNGKKYSLDHCHMKSMRDPSKEWVDGYGSSYNSLLNNANYIVRYPSSDPPAVYYNLNDNNHRSWLNCNTYVAIGASGNTFGRHTYTVYDNIGGSTNATNVYKYVGSTMSNPYSRTGYTLLGYGTTANPAATDIIPQPVATNLVNRNGTMKLYCQWEANPYTVHYDINAAGKVATVSTMADSSHVYDTAQNLSKNILDVAGYTFTGWNTNAAGTGTSYEDEETVNNLTATKNGKVNLYAQWDVNHYEVEYVLNAPEGCTVIAGEPMENTAHTYDVASNLTENAYDIEYYQFMGWSKSPDGYATGNSTVYANKASVKNLTTKDGDVVKLYAQWKYMWNLDTESKEGSVVASFENPGTGGVETPNKSKATLTLHWETFKYTGKPQSPYFTDQAVENFESVTGVAVGEMRYWALVSTFGLARGGGTMEVELEEAPTEPGEYVARVQIAGATLERYFTIVDDDSNYTAEHISNMMDEEGELVHKVCGDTSREGINNASLELHLTDPGDEIDIYRVATIDYDADSESYTALAWDPIVQQWILDRGMEYDEPELLGNVPVATSKKFYTLLIHDDGNVTSQNNGLGEEGLEPYEHASYTLTGDASVDADPVIYIENVEFGQYVVMPRNGYKNFVPSVITILPEKTGVQGSYYVKNVYQKYLKGAEASLVKQIEGAHQMSVEVDEVVSFDLHITMPEYKDRVVLSDTDMVYSYVVSVTDQMSPAFTLLGDVSDVQVGYVLNRADGGNEGEVSGEDTDNGTEGELSGEEPDNSPEGELSGEDTENSTALHRIPSDAVSYQLIADESYTGVGSAERVLIDKEHAVYGADVERNLYYVARSNAPYTIHEAGNVEIDGVLCSCFTVEFDYAALKAYFMEQGIGTLPEIVITYDAQVTPLVQVGSESNFNQAEIYYEVNDEGSDWTTQEDIAYGYTYGVDVHKLDGETNLPLAGAEFVLYKKLYTYRDGVLSNAPILGVDMERRVEPTLSMLEYRIDDDYFIYEWHDESTGEDVFDVYYIVSHSGYDGTLVSTIQDSNADGSGDVIYGIKEGEYVLYERRAPSGYHEVDGGMMFTIHTVNEQELLSGKASSMASMKDMEGNIVTTGLYRVIVLNYAGFALPSTGGVGTMLFTVLGIGLMVLVLMFYFVKRRMRSEEELF